MVPVYLRYPLEIGCKNWTFLEIVEVLFSWFLEIDNCLDLFGQGLDAFGADHMSKEVDALLSEHAFIRVYRDSVLLQSTE